jgi:hypothetical protein
MDGLDYTPPSERNAEIIQAAAKMPDCPIIVYPPGYGFDPAFDKNFKTGLAEFHAENAETMRAYRLGRTTAVAARAALKVTLDNVYTKNKATWKPCLEANCKDWGTEFCTVGCGFWNCFFKTAEMNYKKTLAEIDSMEAPQPTQPAPADGKGTQPPTKKFWIAAKIIGSILVGLATVIGALVAVDS